MNEHGVVTQKKLDNIVNKFNDIETQVTGAKLSCTLSDGEYVIFEIKGRVIGNTNAEMLFNNVCKEMVGVESNIIFDLSNCPYLSSFFLGSIMHLVIAHRKRGFRVCLCNTNEVVDDLIEIINLKKIITVTSTVENAITGLMAC